MDAHDGAILKTEDGWEIRFERRLRHSPQKVWDAIVGPGQMSRWFDRTEFPDPIAVGGMIRFFHDAFNLQSCGKITAVEPPGPYRMAMVLRFHAHQWMSWRILPEGQGCRLIVRQKIADDSLIGRTAAGWHVCLDRCRRSWTAAGARTHGPMARLVRTVQGPAEQPRPHGRTAGRADG